MSQLPDVHQGVLDIDGVNGLFDDLEACTTVLDVLVKGGRVDHADQAPVSLRSAQAALLGGEAFGVQVRYQWDGAEWRDTLLRTPQGFKVVRIKPDWV